MTRSVARSLRQLSFLCFISLREQSERFADSAPTKSLLRTRTQNRRRRFLSKFSRDRRDVMHGTAPITTRLSTSLFCVNQEQTRIITSPLSSIFGEVGYCNLCGVDGAFPHTSASVVLSIHLLVPSGNVWCTVMIGCVMLHPDPFDRGAIGLKL